MKQTLGIVRYNFFGFFRNPKVIFTLFLEFVLSFLLTGRIMVVMDNYNTPVQAIEPFLWTFGDGTAVLLSSMLLLLLFSDLPKMTPVTPHIIKCFLLKIQGFSTFHISVNKPQL